MPDTLSPAVVDAPHPVTLRELIRRERQPLPRHDMTGGNYRQWAAAVCNAEYAHRSRDFARVEVELGITIDSYAYPNCVEWGQYQHESYACAALNWLMHLQTHESERRASWDCLPWDLWPKKRRKDWLASRRVLWAGFVRQVEKYRAARESIDAPVIARAA